jgi:hypothetical protein
MSSETVPNRGWESRYTIAAGFALAGALTMGGAWYELGEAVQDAAPQFHAQGQEKAVLQDSQRNEAILWGIGNALAIGEFAAAAYCARGGWARLMRDGQPLGGEAAPPAPLPDAASPAPITIPQTSH